MNDVVTMFFMNVVLNVIIYSYKIYLLKNGNSDKRHVARRRPPKFKPINMRSLTQVSTGSCSRRYEIFHDSISVKSAVMQLTVALFLLAYIKAIFVVFFFKPEILVTRSLAPDGHISFNTLVVGLNLENLARFHLLDLICSFQDRHGAGKVDTVQYFVWFDVVNIHFLPIHRTSREGCSV